MKSIKRVTFYLLLITTSVLFLSCTQNKKSLVKEVLFHKDVNSKLTSKELNEVNFQYLENTSLGFDDASFWFKILLQEEAGKEKVYLQFKETFLKNIELYDETLHLIHQSNNVKNSNLYIPIQKPTTTLYAKIRFKKNPYISINAYQISFLQQSKNTDLLERGGFYMLIAIIVLLNLFLAYFFKNTIFLWYVLFEANISIGIALYDNTINTLVSNQEYINYLIGFNYLITPIASIMFSIQFLKVNEYYPKLVVFFKILFIPLFIIDCIFIITKNFEVLAYGELIGTILYLSSWILGFIFLKKNNYAIYYVIGYSVLFITGILYSLSISFGWTFLPLNINFLKIGVLLELVVLTFAIMQRAKTMLQELSEMNTQLTFFVNELKQYKSKEHADKNISFEEKLTALAKKHQLTDRETDVLLQISNGLTNQEIANKLFVSINTVKFHTRNIYEKLDIKKRTEITSKLIFN